MKNKIVPLVLSVLISGCSSTSAIKTKTNTGSIIINDNSPLIISSGTPVKKTYPTTSFGQYKFKISESDSDDPMYGLVPLKFNGGYLAADILFFAPAMFFNLREFYSFYEFDTESGIIKYKKNESDRWTSYKPTTSEIQHAKTYFKEIGMDGPEN